MKMQTTSMLSTPTKREQIGTALAELVLAELVSAEPASLRALPMLDGRMLNGLMLDGVARNGNAVDATTLTTATWTRFATYVAPFGNPIANPGGEKCHHRRPKETCS